jgi:RNA polymerase sigma-70 factor (ECF subfamily)
MQIEEPSGMLGPVVSDALLARITLAGDQKAFATLVLRYHTTIFQFVYRFLGNHRQACDVLLPEVCLRFYHALPARTTDTSFKLCLLQMAYNCCIDELRQRGGRTYRFSQFYGAQWIGEAQFMGAVSDLSPLSAARLDRPDLQQILQQALTSLPPEQRAVVILRYVSRLSFAEIGRVLEMPALVAQTCFALAKIELRQYLRERQALIAISSEKM